MLWQKHQLAISITCIFYEAQYNPFMLIYICHNCSTAFNMRLILKHISEALNLYGHVRVGCPKKRNFFRIKDVN